MRRSRGFTLVEIVIAIAILSIILGTAYSSVTQILNCKKILDDKRDLSVTAYAVLRRLTREFQLSVDEFPLLFSEDTTDNKDIPNLFFLGEKGSSGIGSNSSGDSVTFVAQEGGQYLPDGGTHTGMVQLTYRLMKDPEKREDNAALSLVREEIPYATLPNTSDPKEWKKAKEKAFKNRMTFPITDNVESFKVRYYDLENDKWVEVWDQDRKGLLPALIQFSIRLRSPLGSVQTYSTMVPIGAAIKKATTT